jgi:phosphate-selective porin
VRSPTVLAAGFVFLLPVIGRADTDVDVGFYVQPQLKTRQNSDAGDDEDGFTVRRLRLLLAADHPLDCWKLGFRAEVEAFPSFENQDTYVNLSGPLGELGTLGFSLGQFKTPFSRQSLLSDSRLQLVEKAQIASIAPDRQVGVATTLTLPFSEVSLGVFNGDGKNVAQNVDEHFMYVARATFRPFGQGAKLMESAFQGLQLELSGSVAYNRRDRGDLDEKTLWWGVDGFAAWQGLSLTAEYLEARHEFSEGAPEPEYKANGINLQGGYLLPLPGWAYRRFEVAARFEEIDRNDTVPIQQPGNPEQSLRYYTLGASYYHAQHDLKVQLSASHITEVEDLTGNGEDATIPNDTVLLQVTYRQ